MKHLKTFESLLSSGTTVQGAMYATELSDNQVHISHADNVDYTIVKKCTVHWSLNMSEETAGLTGLIPIIKKIDAVVIFKVFEDQHDEDSETKEVEKTIWITRHFNVEEFESVVFPFKPYHLDIEISHEFAVKSATLEFVPRGLNF